MGVTSLKSYMKKEKMCQEIDMCEEIRKVRRLQRKKRDSARKPIIIIFDLLSLTYLFLGGTVGMLGGRHSHSLKIIEIFFKKLINAGAQLVFFCDGNIQTDKVNEWCNRSDKKFVTSMKLMEQGKAEEDDQFSCDPFVQSVRRLIEDNKFGKIKDSTEVDCDRAMAKYASQNEEEVLAIVSNDTDMLIFEGKFQLWSADSIDTHIKPCKAEHLDRTKLSTNLDLSSDQLKIFATMKGNDFTKHYKNNSEMLNMQPVDIARKIKRITNKAISDYEYNDNLYKKIAKNMLKRAVVIRHDHIESVKRSLKFYTLNFNLERYDQRNINIMKHCFINGYPFQYKIQFTDFEPRNERNEKFIHILLRFFQRIGRTLQQQDPDNKHLNKIIIVTKPDRNEKHKRLKQELAPWGEKTEGNEIDIKWQKLLYCIGSSLTIDLKKITETRDNIVMTILSVLFLIQNNEISESQADALLLVHCNILMKKVSQKFLDGLDIPSICNSDTIRTAQAFLKTFTLVNDAFDVCGLTEFSHSVSYDGVYYHYLITKLYERRKTRELIEGCLGSEINAIYNRCKQTLQRNEN